MSSTSFRKLRSIIVYMKSQLFSQIVNKKYKKFRNNWLTDLSIEIVDVAVGFSDMPFTKTMYFFTF